uniref:Caspase-2 n=1 Tax=Ciona savignyi TaxID=51511 RepID=H2YYD2_CIOSA
MKAMNGAHRNLLKRRRPELCQDLEVDQVLQELIGKNIFNDIIADKVLCQPTKYKKNVEFLNLLPGRGPLAFDAFCDALKKSNQSHLAELLVSASLDNSDRSEQFRNEVNLQSGSSSGLYNNRDVPSFYFSSETSTPCMASTSRQINAHLTSARTGRRPRENIDHTANHAAQIYSMNQGSPSKRQRHASISSDEQMDSIPSPADSLTNILSTTSIYDLFGHATRPLQHTTANIFSTVSNTAFAASIGCNNTNDLTAADIADGPTHQDLLVKRSTIPFKQKNMNGSYPMNNKPIGAALIISNEHFVPETGLDNREGGKVDRVRLEVVLRQMGFQCYVLIDGTAQEIIDTLQKFSDLEEHFYNNCTVVAVLSHGDEGYFCGRDGRQVSIENMVDLFNNENCVALHNKPKLFFIQACRGESPDVGVDVRDGPIKPPEGDTESSSNRGSPSSSRVRVRNKLPRTSDTFVGKATMKGFAAMRNTKHGSWYIQALVRVLARHACDKDFLEIMTIVNNIVKQKEGCSPGSQFHRCKEMSEFQSSLSKKLYFFPGL